MAKLRAYISYAPANLTFVERIAADLTARSIEAGVDRGLLATRGGSEGGWDSVRAVIDGSDVLLLITSPPAIANPDVQREIQHAVNSRKLIIPLKLRQVNLPAPVDTIQWFDFEEGRYDRDLKYLLLTLAFVTPGSPPTYDPASQMAKLPEPPESLDALFIAATSAKARGTPEDRERAAAIYASIVERDANFQNGLVHKQLDELNGQLQAQRIQNLERYASDARSSGDWGREIAALNAWGRLQGERAVEPLLATARQNQQHANLYQQAEALVASDPGAASEMLRMLYQAAPKFGDPRGLAVKLGVQRRVATEKTVSSFQPPVASEMQRPAASSQPSTAIKPGSFVPANHAQDTGREGINPVRITPPASSNPATMVAAWVIYAGFGIVGAVIGLILGTGAAAALLNDPNCHSMDFFGNITILCDDPLLPNLIGGIALGLLAAFFVHRRMTAGRK